MITLIQKYTPLIQNQQLDDPTNTLYALLNDFVVHLFQVHSSNQPHLNIIFQNPQLTFNAINNLQIFLKHYLPTMPLYKIFNLKSKTYKINDEGFNSSDDDQLDIQPPHQIKRISKTQQHQNQECHTHKNKIKLLENQIQELESKIKEKDEQIKEMTIGYLKDIQHTKQIYSRYYNQPDQTQEIYEVKYYNLNQTLDPKIKEFLESSIKEASQIYLQKISQLNLKLQTYQSENSQLQRTIDIIIGGKTLKAAVATLFTVEKDIYKIWRVFQDMIGNGQFFQIFDDQKGGYGIDYREIDQHIANSQASYRLYQSKLSVMEDEVFEIMKQFQAQKKVLDEQIKDKDLVIAQLTDQLETQILKNKMDVKAIFEQTIQERETFINRQYEQQKKKLILAWASADHKQLVKKNITKYAIFKWATYAKFLKMYPHFQIFKLERGLHLNEMDYFDFDEVRQQLLKDLLKTKARKKEELQEDQEDQDDSLNQEKQLKEYIEKYQDQLVENQSLVQLNKTLQQRVNKYKHDYILQQKHLITTQNNFRDLESKFNLIRIPFNQILSRLGYKGLDVADKATINILDAGLFEFTKKIRAMNIDDKNLINSMAQIYFKSVIAYESEFNKDFLIDQFTITDICDLNCPIQDMFIEENKQLLHNQLALQAILQPKKQKQKQKQKFDYLDIQDENDEQKSSVRPSISISRQECDTPDLSNQEKINYSGSIKDQDDLNKMSTENNTRRSRNNLHLSVTYQYNNNKIVKNNSSNDNIENHINKNQQKQNQDQDLNRKQRIMLEQRSISCQTEYSPNTLIDREVQTYQNNKKDRNSIRKKVQDNQSNLSINQVISTNPTEQGQQKDQIQIKNLLKKNQKWRQFLNTSMKQRQPFARIPNLLAKEYDELVLILEETLDNSKQLNSTQNKENIQPLEANEYIQSNILRQKVNNQVDNLYHKIKHLHNPDLVNSITFMNITRRNIRTELSAKKKQSMSKLRQTSNQRNNWSNKKQKVKLINLV